MVRAAANLRITARKRLRKSWRQQRSAPRYLLIPFSVIEQDTYAADADVLEISKQLIKENMQAYEVLAK